MDLSSIEETNMTGDYAKIKDALERREYFKLICGAGNESLAEIRRLSTVYTIAGATVIDIPPNVESVKSALEGIDTGEKIARKNNRCVLIRPMVMVSVNAGDDPHFRKAHIDSSKCTSCGNCLGVCDQGAIKGNAETDKLYVFSKKCIGCGKCRSRCPVLGAIQFTFTRYNLSEAVTKCVNAGAEAIELHASTLDYHDTISNWKTISSFISVGQISLCVGRSYLSDEQIVHLVRTAHDIAKDRMIVQADGDPMSGGEDDYNATLQAVSTADIVFKSKTTVDIIVSGGTNSKTRDLANLCGVNINGVAIGSFARKIVRKYVMMDEFDTDEIIVMTAATVAEKLVKQSTGGL
jgi:ferredoxin